MYKICITIFLLNIAVLYPQANLSWAKYFNGVGSGNDYASSLAFDNSGNVYVAGYTHDAVSGGNYYATIKYNSSGTQQWLSRYTDFGGSNITKAVVIDSSGNIYVTGISLGFNTVEYYTTIKYSPAGDSLWVRKFTGPGNVSVPHSMAIDGSGNIYVTGQSMGVSSGYDFATIKYNSAGDSLWVKTYNGTGNADDIASVVKVDALGNVFVTGKSHGIGTGFDYATIKYNSAGVQQWVQTYNGPGNGDDGAASLWVDGSGNVYVTGQAYITSIHDNYATIKYNSAGIQQWVQLYGGSGNEADGASAVVVDGSGNVFVTGSSYNTGTSYDYATVKYNSGGIQQWAKIYNGNGSQSGSDGATAMAIDAAGNIYVTGSSNYSGSGNNYLTIKYNTNGDSLWVQRFSGPMGSDNPAAIAVDGTGSIYITGSSRGSGNDYDMLTLKYSQPIGIRPISSEIPKGFSLSQNYPNPFNPNTKLQFQVSKSGIIKLSVYDILGREVEILVKQQLQPGTYEVDWKAANYPSGIYFYTLSAQDYKTTKKMILSK